MAIELKVKKRNILGKKVKNLRKQGIIPVELFGPKIENKHLSVLYNDFVNVYKKSGRNSIIELNIEGEKDAISTLISDIQIHPIKRKPLSIDFYIINRDTKIEIEIPIELIGEAPAEKEGLIVIKVLDEIEIKSLPQDIPQKIEVDISNLKTIEDHIYVKDLEIPKNIEVETKEDNAVVIISEKEEEIKEPEPTPLGEEGIEENSPTDEEEEEGNNPPTGEKEKRDSGK